MYVVDISSENPLQIRDDKCIKTLRDICRKKRYVAPSRLYAVIDGVDIWSLTPEDALNTIWNNPESTVDSTIAAIVIFISGRAPYSPTTIKGNIKNLCDGYCKKDIDNNNRWIIEKRALFESYGLLLDEDLKLLPSSREVTETDVGNTSFNQTESVNTKSSIEKNAMPDRACFCVLVNGAEPRVATVCGSSGLAETVQHQLKDAYRIAGVDIGVQIQEAPYCL